MDLSIPKLSILILLPSLKGFSPASDLAASWQWRRAEEKLRKLLVFKALVIWCNGQLEEHSWRLACSSTWCESTRAASAAARDNVGLRCWLGSFCPWGRGHVVGLPPLPS